MNTHVTIPPHRSAIDRPGTPSEPELAQRDLATAGEVYLALLRTSETVDLDVINAAIGRAENLLDDDGQRDLLATADALGKQATKKQIGGHVAILIASFPQAGKLDTAFAKILCGDIAAAEPSVGALADGIRVIRRTWRPDFGKVFPSIAEILDAIEAAETANHRCHRSIERLPTLLAEVCARRARLIEDRARWGTAE